MAQPHNQDICSLEMQQGSWSKNVFVLLVVTDVQSSSSEKPAMLVWLRIEAPARLGDRAAAKLSLLLQN